MHVSGLPPPYFDEKKNNFQNISFFPSKLGVGRPEICINVRFKALGARLFISGLPLPYFGNKTKYFTKFIKKNVAEDLRHA